MLGMPGRRHMMSIGCGLFRHLGYVLVCLWRLSEGSVRLVGSQACGQGLLVL